MVPTLAPAPRSLPNEILRVRFSRGIIAALVPLLLAAATLEAQAEVLRWKFKSGEKLTYVMDQKTVTSMKVMGQDIKTTLTQTIDMHWDVKAVGNDGVAQVAQTIDRFRTRIESPFVPVFEFDSNEKKDPEGPAAGVMIPLLRAMVGAEFSMKMQPNGELTEVKIPEKLLNTIKNAGPDAASGGGMFTEEGLKTMLAQSSLTFPSTSLEKGKGWSSQSKIPAPQLGTMVLDKAYTYQGQDPKTPSLVLIDLATKVTIDPAADAKIALKITSQNGKGNFRFNAESGRMESSAVKDTMVMSISAMGQSIDQTTETETSMKLGK